MLRKLLLIALMLALCTSMVVPAQASTFSVRAVEPTDAEQVIRGFVKGQGYVYMNFGRYPFTREGDVRPCLWRVLAVENGYAFLLNEYCVDVNIYHHEKVDQPRWKDFDMYDYMNETMIATMFTSDEQAALEYSDELGRLFILDNLEFMRLEYGFRKIFTQPQKERECELTPYAATLEDAYIHQNGNTTYWSRTCRYTAAGGYEHIVGYDGHISMAGHTRKCAIRPACRVDLSMLDNVSGAGTFDNPFVFDVLPRN